MRALKTKVYGEVMRLITRQLPENSLGIQRYQFARFLFEQIAGGEKVDGEVRATLTLTHEEIAQMIGSSRETVTRLFSDFKRREILQVKGSTVIVRDLETLRKLAEG